MRALAFLSLGLLIGGAQAAEGMWPLNQLPTQALAQAGLKPDTELLRQASVQLPYGSGSFVSAQGLVLTEGYYWDRDDKSRNLAQRFFKRTGRMPNMIQAGTYSATLQYLKAVKAAGTKDTEAVAKKLKELPVNDDFAQGGKVLENGRMVHDLYLFEVKKPSESKKPWDYYKQLAVVPGDKAFPAAKDSGCPLVK